MGVIASLIANLKANTVDFDAKMRKSASGLKSFESQARAVSSGIASAFAKMAAAAGGIYLFKTAAEEADNYGKMAQTLGDTTRNMQALAYAAGQNDTSFESASGAMIKMRKAINEAMDGSKTAQSAFARLGLDVNALAGMSATEQFKAIADAMNKAGDAAGNAGFDIFGRNVAEISVLLQAGSAAIDEASQKMKSFGLSDEQVENIKAMNDRLDAFAMQTKAVAASVIAQFGPGIIKSLDALSNTINGVIGWWNNLSGATKSWMKFGAEAAAIAWALNKAMVFSAIGKGVDMIWSAGVALRGLVVAMRSATIASEVSQAIATGGLSIAKTALGIGAAVAAMAMVDRAFATTSTEAIANAGAMGTNANAVQRAKQEWTEYNRVMENAQSVLKEHRTEIDRINSIISKYSDDAKKISGNEITSQIADIEQVAERTGMGLGWAASKIQELKEAAKSLDAAKSFGEFEEAISSAREETEKLTLSTKELQEAKWRRNGFNDGQIAELRNILDYNERIKKSQEAQKKIAEDKARSVEEEARAMMDAARERVALFEDENRQIKQMNEDANPLEKYKSDKANLDKLNDTGDLTADAYKMQIGKLQDELKRNLGMDSGTGNQRLRQGGTDSVRTGMQIYAMMGGNADGEKLDRKQMLEYLRIIAADAEKNKGRLDFRNN